MPSADLVALYITELRAIRSTGSATAETSFYPPVDRLFNTVGQTLRPPVLFSTQLRNSGAGMPDGGFFPQHAKQRKNSEPLPLLNPERGVVEIKPADYNLDALTNEPQTNRYLQQYGLALITNLREFRLLQLSAGMPKTLERYVLAPSAAALWTNPISSFDRHADLFPDFLRRVMLYRAPLTQPKDVAWLLASYAREAKARAEDHPLASFDAVKRALQESLGIKFEGEKGEHFFRSTLVQTLFYGIFSAWVLWHRSPEGRAPQARFDWRVSAHYLRVPVLRKLFGEVADPGALNSLQLQEVLNLAGEALNRVEESFFSTFRDDVAVAYFYEPFLEAFDPELRKDLGVWYTPKEIVHYMVERVDLLLRSELNQPLGLASPSVRILDPCCGTGAYLTAVLQRIHRTLQEQAGDDDVLVPNDLRTAALSRVFGFEIMPAPFVIAHLQIASLLENAGAPLADNARAGIFLTNALTGWVPERHPQSVIFEEFRREREDSENIKQNDTILVILGNPPYNGYAGIAKIDEERDLTTAYRSQVPGLPAPQGQGLNDLYVRFFRIAERRIVGDAHVSGNPESCGIVSFVSNNAWLDGLSHPSMRHRYLTTFDSVYIDNLNGDKFKTGKTTPEGRPDPSAFSTPQNREGIQLGTAITTLVRHSRSQSSSVIRLRDLWGTGKLAQLESESNHEAEPSYDTFAPVAGLGLPFAERSHAVEYTSWPRLPEVFPFSCPGVKTSRDSLVIDIDRERLEARMRRYLGTDETNAEISVFVPSAMQRSARFDPVATRKALQQKGIRQWQIVKYTYRPFDNRWLYWEPETKLLDEKRDAYMGQLIGATTWLEARQSESGDTFARGTIVNGMADNFGNGLSSFFPAKVIATAGTLLADVEIHDNLSPAAERYIGAIAGNPKDLFFHALTVVHTPAYRAENAGALLGDWPRIPLPGSSPELARSAELGRLLSDLLDPESPISLGAEWSFLGRLHLAAQHDLETALRMESDWGRFQNSKVMPGNGRFVLRDWTASELEKINTLATTKEVTVDEAIGILGDRCVDVYLHGEAFWSTVPANVWEFMLSGYQVLKKWLSYREYRILGRSLRPDETQYFGQMVRRITAILLLGTALDANYLNVIRNPMPLPDSGRLFA